MPVQWRTMASRLEAVLASDDSEMLGGEHISRALHHAYADDRDEITGGTSLARLSGVHHGKLVGRLHPGAE